MEAAVVGDGACVSLVNTLGLGALLTAVARPVEEPVIGVEHDHVLLLILIDPFFINILESINFSPVGWFDVSIVKVFTQDINVD